MTDQLNLPPLSRRSVLKAAGTLIVALVTPTLVAGRNNAWAATPEALDANTFATLVQMSRDIYPHEKVEEKYYAAAVQNLDAAAKKDPDVKKLLTDGVAALDKAAMGLKGGGYSALETEAERLALLDAIKTDAFFQKVRGNLVTGLYNNQELWPLFGYEGESASKGGYIHRGFNDISWL
ncbi:MAG: gluconate 2-dehydrogenase subunit 3 family protein [Hyphomicrobiales bacterium]